MIPRIYAVAELWDHTTNSWVHDYKISTPHNSGGFITSYEFITWNYYTQTWSNQGRIFFTYDSRYNLTHVINEFGDFYTNLWVPYLKTLNYFDCTNLVGINSIDKKQEKFKMYPNPAQSSLFIDSEKEFAEVSLFTISGQQIPCAKNEKTMNVSELEKGVYFIQLLDKNKSVLATEKFIKD